MMPQIDPITLEVVTEALVAVVREMRVTTLRTAYASIISEGQDFSCAIFGPDGQMVAQSEDLPAHVIPIAASIEETLKEFPGDLSPGDLIMINDPFRGGTHLNDVAVISPVFVDGKLFKPLFGVCIRVGGGKKFYPFRGPDRDAVRLA